MQQGSDRKKKADARSTAAMSTGKQMQYPMLSDLPPNLNLFLSPISKAKFQWKEESEYRFSRMATESPTPRKTASAALGSAFLRGFLFIPSNENQQLNMVG